ncbi:MAG: site-specific DNA-methyltransferase, partial [Candidatus Marinimicrobia bacterium]|nr:site-specific DNA-methyltransferase [Candidatus Neomarinimicrobiota bacterium]
MESVSIKYAAKWASEYLKKKVTSSRISYLVQYGAIKNHSENDFGVKIDLGELKNYYEDYYQSMERKWEDAGEENVNWTLSFREFSERETTKHVHRLHPYKGKFIPQLVEYFLDDHVDEFKTEVFFEENSIIIDPFLGSGTTLVQA